MRVDVGSAYGVAVYSAFGNRQARGVIAIPIVNRCDVHPVPAYGTGNWFRWFRVEESAFDRFLRQEREAQQRFRDGRKPEAPEPAPAPAPPAVKIVPNKPPTAPPGDGAIRLPDVPPPGGSEDRRFGGEVVEYDKVKEHSTTRVFDGTYLAGDPGQVKFGFTNYVYRPPVIISTQAVRRIRWCEPDMRARDPSEEDAPPALDQPADATREREGVSLPADSVEVDTRNPVAGKDFPMIDPATGLAVAPDHIFTLPNGLKITAGDYYTELNRLEDEFNRIGYSLARTATQVPDTPVRLQKTRIPAAEMQRSTEAWRQITALTRPCAIGELPTLAKVEYGFQQQQQSMPVRVQNLRPALQQIHAASYVFGKVDFETPYEAPLDLPRIPPLGFPSVFAVEFKFNASLRASSESSQVYADSTFVNHILGFEMPVVTAYAQASSTSGRAGDCEREVGYTLFGQNLFTIPFDVVSLADDIENLAEDNYQPPDLSSSKIKKSVDFGYEMRFFIGPIPMSARVGVRAAVGIEYGLGVSGLDAHAFFGPFIRSDAYVQAGIDVVILEAGVRCSLLLLDLGVPINGSVSLYNDEQMG